MLYISLAFPDVFPTHNQRGYGLKNEKLYVLVKGGEDKVSLQDLATTIVMAAVLTTALAVAMLGLVLLFQVVKNLH
ncbi:MAG: hypothetical protein OYG31_01655 [Candidatus Kaiserbacteria bacterium]|nr:hypothetical protein [Candidatus Kaiserbacteria bacterium]